MSVRLHSARTAARAAALLSKEVVPPIRMSPPLPAFSVEGPEPPIRTSRPWPPKSRSEPEPPTKTLPTLLPVTLRMSLPLPAKIGQHPADGLRRRLDDVIARLTIDD